tara:strand:- start:1006 stop:1296 length:291 start_codon:yes stop_codon:yes gene_type:complete
MTRHTQKKSILSDLPYFIMCLAVLYGAYLALSALMYVPRDVRLCEESMHRSGEFNTRFYVPHLGREFCSRTGWRTRITQGSQVELQKLETQGAFTD